MNHAEVNNCNLRIVISAVELHLYDDLPVKCYLREARVPPLCGLTFVTPAITYSYKHANKSSEKMCLKWGVPEDRDVLVPLDRESPPRPAGAQARILLPPC